MGREGMYLRVCVLVLVSIASTGLAVAQQPPEEADAEFGPVVRAYLGYLRSEQEVVDDRVSRHEVSRAYYRRNSNRIRALRKMAVQIARETENDFLPEMEAVTRDELGTLFEDPPKPGSFQLGEVLNNTFRFLGAVRTSETFYIFARLDPYEQAELIEKQKARPVMAGPSAVTEGTSGEGSNRPRRVTTP
ncbi:MAG TPA: hypothetical protein VD966_03235 [Pyrinomonadaceae bacterium]|nr:hypothetical protein [Pyrinomonadaceae bacterium]